MRTYKYVGLFISVEGHQYKLDVNCNGFLQAFFLLTADAIRSTRHYQLNSIEDEHGHIKYVSDILKVGELLS
jgi:hypothetical protein